MDNEVLSRLLGFFGGGSRSPEEKASGSGQFFRNLSLPEGFFGSSQQRKPQELVSPIPSGAPLPTSLPSPRARPVPQQQVQPPVPQQEGRAGVPGLSSTQVPMNILDIIRQEAQKQKLNEALLSALFFQESRFDPSVIAGPQGNRDRGIAQINERAYPDVTDEQALDPNFAIPFAAQTLRGNIDYFGGDINRGVSAYNVGRGGASQDGPIGRTYLDNILRNLDPELLLQLGASPSGSLADEFVSSGRAPSRSMFGL